MKQCEIYSYAKKSIYVNAFKINEGGKVFYIQIQIENKFKVVKQIQEQYADVKKMQDSEYTGE